VFKVPVPTADSRWFSWRSNEASTQADKQIVNLESKHGSYSLQSPMWNIDP
jgi:hypothetical protein